MKKLASSDLFTIKDMNEVLRLLSDGKKLQCEEWHDSEFIVMAENMTEDMIDECGHEVNATVLVNNSMFNWRVIE